MNSAFMTCAEMYASGVMVGMDQSALFVEEAGSMQKLKLLPPANIMMLRKFATIIMASVFAWIYNRRNCQNFTLAIHAAAAVYDLTGYVG